MAKGVRFFGEALEMRDPADAAELLESARQLFGRVIRRANRETAKGVPFVVEDFTLELDGRWLSCETTHYSLPEAAKRFGLAAPGGQSVSYGDPEGI